MNGQSLPRLRKILPLLFWCAAIFAFVMAVLPKPPPIPGDPSDKSQHIIAFAVLASLAAAAFPSRPLWRIILGLVLFGAAIELTQMIPMLGRSASWADLAADSAAVLVAAPLTRWVIRAYWRET